MVRREIEGFVLNRLQGALLAEAFRLVGEGYVSPQDLDKTIKDGLGLRWSFMGPFATIELNAPGGIADYCARYTGFYKRLQAKPAEVEVFEDANVANILREWGKQATPEELAELTRWRDQRLAAMAAHKKGQPGAIEPLVPAEAGTQFFLSPWLWISACAGMSGDCLYFCCG